MDELYVIYLVFSVSFYLSFSLSHSYVLSLTLARSKPTMTILSRGGPRAVLLRSFSITNAAWTDVRTIKISFRLVPPSPLSMPLSLSSPSLFLYFSFFPSFFVFSLSLNFDILRTHLAQGVLCNIITIRIHVCCRDTPCFGISLFIRIDSGHAGRPPRTGCT